MASGESLNPPRREALIRIAAVNDGAGVRNDIRADGR